jgi:hypothetical protein
MRPRVPSCRALTTAATVAVVALAASGCAQVTTGQATSVTASTATLKAQVKGDGKAFTYWFQYGKSTSYGARRRTAAAGRARPSRPWRRT